MLEPSSSCPITKHVAFLSSLSGAFRGLREDIHAVNAPLLWVAEGNCPDLVGNPPMEIVDACLEALASSELFICLLIDHGQGASEGGTPINVSEIEAQVSYFEIEVFAAAARGLPIVFLQTEGFNPGERLAEWLKILECSAVPVQWLKGCKMHELAKHVKELIARRVEFIAAQAAQAQASLQRLATDLVLARGRINEVRSGQSDLLWSSRNRFERPHSDDEVLRRARLLLAEVEAQPDSNRKLSRLYLVFRELFARPYGETKSSDLLACWNDALGQWWGASSWYGLHAHLSMGVISTLWTQGVVRAKLATTSHTDPSKSRHLFPPHGPLASSYYSLGKILVGTQREAVLRASLAMTEKVILEHGKNEPSIYAVRGCVQFLLRQPVRGMASFQKLLRLGHRAESVFLVAEAHSYLGRAYGEMHCTLLARMHLKKSVEAWQVQVETQKRDHAFYVKALKNLAAFQESSGQLSACLETTAKAHAIAIEYKVYDQARQLSEIQTRVRAVMAK